MKYLTRTESRRDQVESVDSQDSVKLSSTEKYQELIHNIH